MKCRAGHDFAGALAAAGLRPTPRRLALIAALHESGPLSADEAAAAAGKIAPMDRATSYRNLESLARAGLVSATGESAAATRYELADHHTHAVTCQRCGLVARLEGCGLEALDRAALSAAKGFAAITGHSLSWTGVCRACARPSPGSRRRAAR